ncbi:hypothetical protein HYALB_00007493 [Hymenoscyphus albidus]|uniref:Uncharacterized protein n=1 Tax=Hymenoscyphus albidus TaxID=595503 RepID=A0A9N9M3I3_9HELO|nr:hypothetical protein HYALB_00007493 [Hymenoscyphus albidus]
MPPKIPLLPHSPTWLTHFTLQKSHLTTLLSPLLSTDTYRIEHVGSTCIPDLPAKPVLDIDIFVPRHLIEAVRARLVEKGGYMDLGELGIQGRWVMRQPGYGAEDVAGVVDEDEDVSDGKREGEEKGKAGMRINTYVVEEGCVAGRNHEDVKRVLLQYPDLRKEYGDVKRAVVERTVDMDEYVRGKNEVVLRILERAGWSEGELEGVRRANE